MRLPGGVPTAHIDGFARELLPPVELWPQFDYSASHLCHYPDRLNAGSALIDTAVADGFGAKPVYHYLDGTWNFAHLQDQANRIARVLVEDYGLVPGNRVLLRSGNTPMLAACWLAVLKAGGICVTTMPLLRARELAYIIEKVQIRIALSEIDLAEDMELTRAQAPGLDHIAYFTPLGDGRHSDANLDHAAARKPAVFQAMATAADDIALITFTSGTSGHPKAAAHFHRDILASADSWPLIYTIEPDEILCGSPSMAFTYGMATFLIYPMRYRVTAVLLPRPTPDQILEAIERHRATSLYTVPTSYHAVLQELGRYDISSLRKCTSAGEHLRPSLWEDWREATGLRIVNALGMTEFLTHFISETLAVDHPGSIGRAIPGYTACVLDEEFNVLPPGNRGLLAVRGPTGGRYLGDIERQRNFVRNGWNVTGDIMDQDAEGWFWYVDRSDNMIISSGYNISAQEVEEVIAGHPMVAECAVVSVPDPVRGNVVRACIVLAEGFRANDQTARDIQDYVKATIAPYKYPRDIKFMDELPRTQTGKIQRFRLREL